jgi:linoleoyl-CoA desaturase
MHVKTAVLFAGFAGAYVLLVFEAHTWAQALALAVLLGLFIAGIGFNVQHDGGHQAYAKYGLFVLKWQLVVDFWKLISGRMESPSFPRPKGWDLVIFLAGKAVFFVLAFGIPLQFHSIGVVLCYYGGAGAVARTLLSVVFQVAHCVDEAAFPVPHSRTDRVDQAWAIHQVETTADFARGNRVATWLVGGFNFQIEHHRFPRISHVHYPALSPLVEQTCREFGVRYATFRSFRIGLVSHFRWLRRMGC